VIGGCIKGLFKTKKEKKGSSVKGETIRANKSDCNKGKTVREE